MAYARMKAFWGAVDVTFSDEAVYTGAQVKPLGTNANAPGIGVRRAMLVWEREPVIGPPEDSAVSHVDFLNITGGNPDDTWTAGDFTTLEGLIDTWWGNVKGSVHSSTILHQIRWYRVGPGLSTPNPAVRITERDAPGTSVGDHLPPQIAATVTNRTAVRLEWGRMYIPDFTVATLKGENGRINTTYVDGLATNTDILYQAATAAEFYPVVWGKARNKVYTIESVQVDDLFDVQRRRRWDSPIYRKRIPTA
jgi:hypothetical protein